MQFRNNRDNWRTKSLFIDFREKHNIDDFEEYYCLTEHPREKFGKVGITLYDKFMDSTDEYEFAVNHLGGLGHLDTLKKSVWFMDGHRSHRGYKAWTADMKLRDESFAKKALMEAVHEGKVQAASKIYDASVKGKKEGSSLTIRPDRVARSKKAVDEDNFLDEVSSRLNVIKFRD